MENKQQIEVRKISLKTYIYMGIIVVLGAIFFLIAENGKQAKATKILEELGYNKVEDVWVYSIKKVEDMDTKIQGYRYFIKFKDLNTNKICEGFILKDFKHKIDQELTCKEDAK